MRLSDIALAIKTPCKRWVYDFDGVDDYGVFSDRMIDPDWDIEIKWEQRDFVLGQSRALINQTDIGTFGESEFRMWWASDARLIFQIGIGSISFLSTNFKPTAIYRVSLKGTTLKLFVDGVLSQTLSYSRGTVREPLAPTRVLVRFNGSSFVDHASGTVPFFEINGTLYPINNPDSNIQYAEGDNPAAPTQPTLTLVNTNPERWSKVKC